MKRWLLATLTVIVVVTLVFVLRSVTKAQAEKKREVAYRAALQVYSRNLKRGSTRKDVESYLRSENISYSQMCCILERSAFADLIKIGQEDAPWYCSDEYVYIALEFTATEARSLQSPIPISDSDVLKTVEIYRQLAGCL